MSIRFTSGTTGYITFPTKARVAISRFNFGYGAVADSLRGFWTFSSIGSEGLQSDLVELTKTWVQQPMETALRLMPASCLAASTRCAALAGNVMCVKINSSGQLLRTYILCTVSTKAKGIRKHRPTALGKPYRFAASPRPTALALVWYINSRACDRWFFFTHAVHGANFQLRLASVNLYFAMH